MTGSIMKYEWWPAWAQVLQLHCWGTRKPRTSDLGFYSKRWRNWTNDYVELFHIVSAKNPSGFFVGFFLTTFCLRCVSSLGLGEFWFTMKVFCGGSKMILSAQCFSSMVDLRKNYLDYMSPMKAPLKAMDKVCCRWVLITVHVAFMFLSYFHGLPA